MPDSHRPREADERAAASPQRPPRAGAASILVRDAVDADMAAVARIYAHYVRFGLATFEEQPPSAADLRLRRDAILADRLPYLVATAGTAAGATVEVAVDTVADSADAATDDAADGAVSDSGDLIVGYAYAGVYRARPAYRYTVEDSVYVADGLGGRGIGRALLEALIARCEAGPWRQMIAVIGDSGNAGSIALHARLGFRMTGTFEAVGFKLGRWVDTVLMQRALGDGSRSLPDGHAGSTR